MKILIVDDERVLVKGLRFNLENEGYQVVTGYDGQQAVELARQERPDLILMDVMMPGISGMDACMQIREFSDVPVIMLTAKGEDMDKIMGFECGADDYVTKPFNVLELKARVKALLRRSSGNGNGAAGRYRDPEDTLVAGHITLSRASRDVQREGLSVDLTAKEFDLLELLMSHPGRVFSREKLLDQVWGYEYQGDYRTVDVHIRRLREKVELVPASPQYILTKWGVGYYFAANK
ncbi:MAG: response regulator transcription factor [Clostridiales bacterium]|nr:response regulator transcription factor [Clostridiales bacterium]